MKAPISTGIIAGAIAVTGCGGVSVVGEGRSEAVRVTFALAGAFRPAPRRSRARSSPMRPGPSRTVPGTGLGAGR